jgi:hypothetical protein
VHVGKAAALIVVALVLGVLVLRDSGGGGFTNSAAIRDAIEDSFTETTLPPDDEVTSTTLAAERPANVVKVIAINASGKAGEAGRATVKLQAAGYNALQAGNATAAVTNSRPASLVYVVTAGYEREARTVAALFSLPDSAVRALPSPSPSSDIKGDVNIAVLVGTGITI